MEEEILNNLQDIENDVVEMVNDSFWELLS